ncbi:MAG: glycosyltransferase [Blautia sp.]|nr:glycosyltransferase [Blautia sp.]
MGGAVTILLPRTSNPYELAAIYTAADVFINTTYEDTYPTVNLEAQACGTPVITYNSCGCKETLSLTASKTVSAGNIRGVADQILNWNY